MDKKIAIICPYFGKLPVWFDLLLYSCSRNESIDFYFFTDCDIPKTYGNTIFYRISFEDYCNLVSSKLTIKFQPNSPYKLCDLKPFYGIIHKDLIGEYDFWGFADMDLVYGDLSELVKKVESGRYDLITTHADRVAGHFTLIRNASRYTDLCYKIHRWNELLQDDYVYGLDEHHFTLLVYPFQKQIWRMFRYFGSYLGIVYYNFFQLFNNITNKFSRHHFQEYYTSILPKDGEVWTYNLGDGCLKDPKGRNLPYLHFLFFKKTQHYNANRYWTDGFWRIDSRVDFAALKGEIVFTNEKVESL